MLPRLHVCREAAGHTVGGFRTHTPSQKDSDDAIYASHACFAFINLPDNINYSKTCFIQQLVYLLGWYRGQVTIDSGGMVLTCRNSWSEALIQSHWMKETTWSYTWLRRCSRIMKTSEALSIYAPIYKWWYFVFRRKITSEYYIYYLFHSLPLLSYADITTSYSKVISFTHYGNGGVNDDRWTPLPVKRKALVLTTMVKEQLENELDFFWYYKGRHWLLKALGIVKFIARYFQTCEYISVGSWREVKTFWFNIVWVEMSTRLMGLEWEADLATHVHFDILQQTLLYIFFTSFRPIAAILILCCILGYRMYIWDISIQQ